MTSIHIHARIYGSASEPKVIARAYVYEGGTLTSSMTLAEEHLVIFNCIGALLIEAFIEVIRSVNPEVSISYSEDEADSIGTIANSVALDINRKISEGAAA